MKNQSCENCRFWAKGSALTNNGMAGCRRYPPQMIVMPVQSMQGMQFAPAAAQPQTQPTQWCGEWAGQENVIAMNQ